MRNSCNFLTSDGTHPQNDNWKNGSFLPSKGWKMWEGCEKSPLFKSKTAIFPIFILRVGTNAAKKIAQISHNTFLIELTMLFFLRLFPLLWPNPFGCPRQPKSPYLHKVLSAVRKIKRKLIIPFSLNKKWQINNIPSGLSTSFPGCTKFNLINLIFPKFIEIFEEFSKILKFL